MFPQVKYLEVAPLIAAALIKKGDFLAPSYPQHKYGYGCLLYDKVCDFSTEGARQPLIYVNLILQQSSANMITLCLLDLNKDKCRSL